MNVDRRQRSVCTRHRTEFDPPSADSRLGIALQTLHRVPINGLRHPPEGAMCGWYIWAGGEIEGDSDFFQPLCLEHMDKYCSVVLDYLALPPGWRFQIDAFGYEDVWFDEKLLEV